MSVSSTSTSTTFSASLEKGTPIMVPRIPVNPLNHKLAIAIQFGVLFTTTCLVPEVVWFALYYGTNWPVTNIVAVAGAIFGAPAFFQFFVRLWRLAREESEFRPLGAENKRWALDYFQWNYALGIVYITVLESVGSALEPPLVRLLCMALPALMLQVCGQMVLMPLLRAAGIKTPFAISSTRKGEILPSAVSVIVEDIIAVDARQGTEFRKAWQGRVNGSPVFANLMNKLDLVWGTVGVSLAITCIAVNWTVENVSVGWALGWTIPWIYVAVMSWVTYFMVKSAQKEEQRQHIQLV